MVNMIVNKDGTLALTPLIANVSDKGIVECLYLSFDKQPGTLAYFIYEDDYGATHTKLVSVNNTVSINSYKSSSLRIQLRIINAATGEAVFESQWSELALSNVNVEPDAGYPQPPVFGPHGPHSPHHDHRPHRNYLYEFCSKLHTAIAVEVTNRETADKQLSEMLLTHNTTLNNSITALSERLDKHISDMKPLVIQGVIQEETDTGGYSVSANATYAQVVEAIECHRAIYLDSEDLGINHTVVVYSFLDDKGDAYLFIPSTAVAVMIFYKDDATVSIHFTDWVDFVKTYSFSSAVSISDHGVNVTDYDDDNVSADVQLNKVTSSGTVTHKLSEKANTSDTISVQVGYQDELDTYRSGIYRIEGMSRPDTTDDGFVYYPDFEPYYVICECLSVMVDWYKGATIWQTRIMGTGIAVRMYEVDNSPSPEVPEVGYDDLFDITAASEPATASISDELFTGGEWTVWFDLLSENTGYNKTQIDSKVKTLAEIDEGLLEQIEKNTEAIEKLQKQRIVGFASITPLVADVTCQLTLAYVGDLSGGRDYTYVLKRGDDEVVRWNKSNASDTTSQITLATTLAIADGNSLLIYNGDVLVCDCELKVYNNDETTMLQLVTYSE